MWKKLLLISLLGLLFSVLLPAEVCLTDEEAAELNEGLATLEKLLEEQNQELAFQEIQLNALEQEIVKLEVSLKLVETSWREQKIELTKKTIVLGVGSLIVGGSIGLLSGILLK